MAIHAITTPPRPRMGVALRILMQAIVAVIVAAATIVLLAAPADGQAADDPVDESWSARWSFQPRGVPVTDGWVAADGTAFDEERGFGWRAADGRERQCGDRNTIDDQAGDTFCHATTIYTRVGGRWEADASPATWSAVVPDGSYTATVVVGESRFAFSNLRHSVQVEGVVVHDNTTTSSSEPLVSASADVEVTDGRLDVHFLDGHRTKIVSVELVAHPEPEPVPDPDPTPDPDPSSDPDPDPAPDPDLPQPGFEGLDRSFWLPNPVPAVLPETAFVITVTTTDDIAGEGVGGEMSLRSALDVAALLELPVTVMLEPGATYQLSCGTDEDENLDGDLDHLSPHLLAIVGDESTIVGADGCEERLIDSPGGGDLYLGGVTLSRGTSTSDGGAIRGHHVELVNSTIELSTADRMGGGIWASGTVDLVASTIGANSAAAGGGIAADDGVTVFDSVIADNAATHDGGAIHASMQSSVTISGSLVVGNESSFGRGGAMFAAPLAVIDIADSTFADNVAWETFIGGGAIYADGSLTISGSRFERNGARSVAAHDFLSTGGGGGAVYAEGETQVVDSVFVDNQSGTAGAGGALHTKGFLTVVASEFTANVAGGAGGAIHAAGGHIAGNGVYLESVVLDSNVSSGTGGGGAYLATDSEIVIVDSMVRNNAALTTGANGGGLFLAGRASVSTTTVRDNTTTFRGAGGGIHVDVGGSLEFVDGDVIDNTAGLGGGIDADDGPGSGLLVTGSNLLGNQAAFGSHLSSRAPVTLSGSVFEVVTSGTMCAFADPALWIDPNLGADASCAPAAPVADRP